MIVNAYTDASLVRNPGLGSVAIVLDTNPRYERTFILDRPLTINQSEHLAVLLAVRAAVELGVTHLRVHSDSQLVVRQITGRYRTLSASLAICVETTRRAAAELERFEVVWVPREENLLAHALANSARKETTDVCA